MNKHIDVKLIFNFEGHETHGETVIPGLMAQLGGPSGVMVALHALATSTLTQFVEDNVFPFEGLKPEPKVDLKKNEYQCFMCKGVFEKGRSDDEAMEEARDRHGDEFSQSDGEIVCDDCFKEVMGGVHDE